MFFRIWVSLDSLTHPFVCLHLFDTCVGSNPGPFGFLWYCRQAPWTLSLHMPLTILCKLTIDIGISRGGFTFLMYVLSRSFINDPTGYWWPPAYSTWTPTIVSFSFSVSLIVAQFTIFGSFSGPELPEPFWGPKRRFWASNLWRIWFRNGIDIPCQQCSPQIDIFNDVSCASNGDSMPKLRPLEIDVPIYPDEAHIPVFHLLWLGFWMFGISIVSQ